MAPINPLADGLPSPSTAQENLVTSLLRVGKHAAATCALKSRQIELGISSEGFQGEKRKDGWTDKSKLFGPVNSQQQAS